MVAAPTSDIGKPDWAWAEGILGSQWWETSADLLWPTSAITYARMRNDPQLQAVLGAYILPIMRATWVIDPEGCQQKVARHVADDLGLPLLGKEQDRPGPARRRGVVWERHLREALAYLVFGHAAFERRYREEGGVYHLENLGTRPQWTLSEIRTRDDGTVREVLQTTQRDPIPGSRLAWYVRGMEGAAWQGQSMLRCVYGAWLLKSETWRVHAGSIRRWGLGVPHVQAPAGATTAQVQQARDLAAAMRGGDQSGMGTPQGWTAEILGITGSVPDALAFIEYLDRAMAKMALAGLIELGQTETGSRALGETFLNLFTLSLQSVADEIALAATSGWPGMPGIVTDLVDQNWGEDEPAPRIVCTDVGESYETTAEAVAALLTAGALTADPDLEAWIRRTWRLPEKAKIPPGEPPPAGSPPGPPAAPGGQRAPGPGVPPIPGPAPARQQAAPGVAAASPFRRAVSAIEAASGFDPGGVEAEWRQALDRLSAAYRGVQAVQARALADQAVEAAQAGRLREVRALAADTSDGARVIADAMRGLCEAAAWRMMDEMERQGRIVGPEQVKPDYPRLRAMAAGRAELLGQRLASEAMAAALQAAPPVMAAFDPRQPRDPHTGEWTEMPGAATPSGAPRPRDWLNLEISPEQARADRTALRKLGGARRVPGGLTIAKGTNPGFVHECAEAVRAMPQAVREVVADHIAAIEIVHEMGYVQAPEGRIKAAGEYFPGSARLVLSSQIGNPRICMAHEIVHALDVEGDWFGAVSQGAEWESICGRLRKYEHAKLERHFVPTPKTLDLERAGNAELFAELGAQYVLSLPMFLYDPADGPVEPALPAPKTRRMIEDFMAVQFGPRPARAAAPAPASSLRCVAVILPGGRTGYLWVDADGKAVATEGKTVMAAVTTEPYTGWVVDAGFNPNQPRDPRTGEWTDTGGLFSPALEKLIAGLKIVRDPHLRNEARTFDQEGGVIHLGPKFDQLPTDLVKRAVLVHEAAHAAKLDDWYVSNHDDMDLAAKTDYGNLNGQTTPGEIMAEGYSALWDDPEWVGEHAPALVPIIREGAAAVGLPVPPPPAHLADVKPRPARTPEPSVDKVAIQAQLDETLAAYRTAKAEGRTADAERLARQAVDLQGRLLRASGLVTAAERRLLTDTQRESKLGMAAIVLGDQVANVLGSLSDRLLNEQLGAALHAAQNEGRFAALHAGERVHGPAEYIATEILDANTCAPCRDIDGHQFGDLATAELAYINGGYVGCLGGLRCRGTLIAHWADVPVVPLPQPLRPAAAAWVEREHPRGHGGKFVKKLGVPEPSAAPARGRFAVRRVLENAADLNDSVARHAWANLSFARDHAGETGPLGQASYERRARQRLSELLGEHYDPDLPLDWYRTVLSRKLFHQGSPEPPPERTATRLNRVVRDHFDASPEQGQEAYRLVNDALYHQGPIVDALEGVRSLLGDDYSPKPLLEFWHDALKRQGAYVPGDMVKTPGGNIRRVEGVKGDLVLLEGEPAPMGRLAEGLVPVAREYEHIRNLGQPAPEPGLHEPVTGQPPGKLPWAPDRPMLDRALQAWAANPAPLGGPPERMKAMLRKALGTEPDAGELGAALNAYNGNRWEPGEVRIKYALQEVLDRWHAPPHQLALPLSHLTPEYPYEAGARAWDGWPAERKTALGGTIAPLRTPEGKFVLFYQPGQPRQVAPGDLDEKHAILEGGGILPARNGMIKVGLARAFADEGYGDVLRLEVDQHWLSERARAVRSDERGPRYQGEEEGVWYLKPRYAEWDPRLGGIPSSAISSPQVAPEPEPEPGVYEGDWVRNAAGAVDQIYSIRSEQTTEGNVRHYARMEGGSEWPLASLEATEEPAPSEDSWGYDESGSEFDDSPGLPEIASTPPTEARKSLLASYEAGPPSEQYGIGDGQQAVTRLVTLEDGTSAVSKRFHSWSQEGDWSAAEMADAEFLAGRVCEAVGNTGAPPVIRGKTRDAVVMGFVDGETAEDYGRYYGYRDDPPHNARNKHIGLADYLNNNSDRHGANFMVGPDGENIAIDNGSTYGIVGGGERTFAHMFVNLPPAEAIGTADWKAIKARLRKLEPLFTQAGEESWWQELQDRIHRYDEARKAGYW